MTSHFKNGKKYGNASAIDLETGKEVWKTEDNITGISVYSSKRIRFSFVTRRGFTWTSIKG
jgi:outer membrane protein assembly factor BamB